MEWRMLMFKGMANAQSSLIRLPVGPFGSLSTIEVSPMSKKYRAARANAQPAFEPSETAAIRQGELTSSRLLWLFWIGLAIAGVSASYIPAVHQAVIVFFTN